MNSKVKGITSKIGKSLWIALGIFLLIITISWARYAFGGNGFGSIIILILLPVFAVLLLIYLIITAVYIIKNRNKRK
jgi:4-hydroxybenzoate polyprenyltransferase